MFPRTNIENLSVSRLMIGTNWFLGYSHTSKAKDKDIVETMTAERIADIVEVFMNAGVDTLYGITPEPKLAQGVAEAEQRTGRKCITLAIPSLPLEDTAAARGEAERALDELVEIGVAICMPHQCTTDAFVDRRTRSLAGIEVYLRMIRERGMIPGLGTHMPETPAYADASGLDVATYCQIYNAAGFLMQIEIDWVQRMIWEARKPVITIKPLAAGKLPPLVGLSFSWSTIRDSDMVCIGTSTPYEAEEIIEFSLAILEHRVPCVELQKTRSKQSLAKQRD
ncbi:hypothetical protein ACFL34_02480 [Candidatus Sumerlaeota bacterium]